MPSSSARRLGPLVAPSLRAAAVRKVRTWLSPGKPGHALLLASLTALEAGPKPSMQRSDNAVHNFLLAYHLSDTFLAGWKAFLRSEDPLAPLHNPTPGDAAALRAARDREASLLLAVSGGG